MTRDVCSATVHPQEATDKMCVAGASIIQQHIATNGIENDLKAAADIWRAMVACMPSARTYRTELELLMIVMLERVESVRRLYTRQTLGRGPGVGAE